MTEQETKNKMGDGANGFEREGDKDWTTEDKFLISLGHSRKEMNWKIKEFTWSELVERLTTPVRTAESLEEFRALGKTQQDELKDVGGYVGGPLKGGQRKAGHASNRTIGTWDADHISGGRAGGAEFVAKVRRVLDGVAWVLYPTRKSTESAPRYRLVVPFSRPLLPEQYQAVMRRVAGDIGINYFDDSTYEPERLMYWPSVSRDADFDAIVSGVGVGESSGEGSGRRLDVERVLAQYVGDEGWRDSSQWPVADRFTGKLERQARHAGDPWEKQGLVGAFCRSYTIGAAISEFLSDVYGEAGVAGANGRYSYLKGSAVQGLVVYGDGRWAYSHHSTDPAGMRLCNAYDLVRLHRFGELDRAEGAVGEKASTRAMNDWCGELEPVRLELLTLRGEAAKAEFGVVEPEAEGAGAGGAGEAGGDGRGEGDDEGGAGGVDWREGLELDRNGKLVPSRTNYYQILVKHPALRGALRYDEMLGLPVRVKDVPWRRLELEQREGERRGNGKGQLYDYWTDADMVALAIWFEKLFGAEGFRRSVLDEAFALAVRDQSYHPVKDYLNGLSWDGVLRAERVFIDYLGAVDTEFDRAVARMLLSAAVKRVLEPGCKWDYMPILVGAQGTKKSTFLQVLGKRWTSDELNTVRGKEAIEAIQGAWIVEVAELAATRRAEVEAVKHFISKREDKARLAYARNVSVLPRQCVFIGTTNSHQSLNDITGGRRFLMIEIGAERATKDVFTDLPSEVDQIWAEVYHHVLFEGWADSLYMAGDLLVEATARQEAHQEDDGLAGMIGAWIEQEVPVDWLKWPAAKRAEFNTSREHNGVGIGDGFKYEGDLVPRDRVCAIEVWVECLGEAIGKMPKWRAQEINIILSKMPGWSKAGVIRAGQPYGRQKGFTRDGTGAGVEASE